MERLARHHLQLGIERGAHRQPALVELGLAVFLIDLAPHLLGEIFGREDVRAGRARRNRERLLLRLLAFLRRDVAVLDQAIDHVVAPLGRALARAERMIVVGRLGERGEIGGLGDRELMHRLVEIEQRGGGDAVGAHAEVDFVEVKLEDFLFGIGALDAHRQQRFLDLAVERDLVGQQEVLRHLLGDGGGALRALVAAEILHEHDGRARDAGKIDAAVLVEILVLRGDEGVDHELGDRLDRQIEAAFARVFGEQRPVGRVHPGHHRRLVILQLRILRQALGKMPEQAGRGGDADEKQDRAGREQEA